MQMTAIQPDGFLALPSSGSGAGVLVLHAWWGLNSTVKALCSRLAEAGFVAFAPDLYHGKVAHDIAAAEALSRELFDNLEAARSEVAASAAVLNRDARTMGEGLAVIGLSLGAFLALDVSVSAPDAIRLVVTFYGTRPGDYHASRAEYLAHFADEDEFEPQSEVDALREALTRAGRPASFHVYAGTRHWFFEADRQEYHPAAAALAWERTLSFLRRSPGVQGTT